MRLPPTTPESGQALPGCQEQVHPSCSHLLLTTLHLPTPRLPLSAGCSPVLQIPDLSAFTNLRMLELSYNEIRSLAPLASLTAGQLTELYVASNKVTKIEGISQLTGGCGVSWGGVGGPAGGKESSMFGGASRQAGREAAGAERQTAVQLWAAPRPNPAINLQEESVLIASSVP